MIHLRILKLHYKRLIIVSLIKNKYYYVIYKKINVG